MQLFLYSLSLFDLISKGGFVGVLIIIVLFLIFGGAIYIYIERFLILKNIRNINRNFVFEIESLNQDNVINLCQETEAPIAKLIERVVIKSDKSYDEIIKSVEEVASLELHKLEKNISLLATGSSIAPMLGFLGTVVGMILSFYNLSQSSGQIEVSLLADGIYTAMTTTVIGLIVGIVSNLAYNHLVVQTKDIIHSMQAEVIQYMDNHSL